MNVRTNLARSVKERRVCVPGSPRGSELVTGSGCLLFFWSKNSMDWDLLTTFHSVRCLGGFRAAGPRWLEL